MDHTRHSRDKPGPGAYNPSDVESLSGSYIISNFRNTGNVKFIKPKMQAAVNGGVRSRTPLPNRQSKLPQTFSSFLKGLFLVLS